MNIDWNHFTPGLSFSGGLLIGLAAAIFILFNGRILGVSGIIAGLLKPSAGDISWRIVILAGMASAPLLMFNLAPATWLAAPQIDAGYPVLIAAGLLVGIGTRLGSGCTSGHGVCGLSRLSPRSLVATLSFMSAGFITVYLLRHIF